MHFDDFERHECTLNSSELAGHSRALQRSKHQLLFTYRNNPYSSVSTLFGEQNLKSVLVCIARLYEIGVVDQKLINKYFFFMR